MQMVKSVVCEQFGGIEKIKVIDLPLKELTDDEVQVEVHYCGLNFADLYTRLGLFPKEESCFILGIECSGIVRTLGKNVTQFKVGDRVVCYDYTGGLHRSTININSSNCYNIPDDISLKTAAATFVAFLTAYCCLFKIGNLTAGQHILVHSCAGAVGAAAVQLARTVPQVQIWGTTSNPDKVLPDTVHHIMSYDEYLDKVPLGSIDVLIDNQTFHKYIENLKLLRPFGKLIVTGANYMIKENQLTFSKSNSLDIMPQLIMGSISVGGLHLGEVARHFPKILQDALNHIWELLQQELVVAHVDSIWAFDSENVRNATTLLQGRKNQAKILLQTTNALDV